MYDYADQNGIFLSSNGMACAASAKAILKFLDVCISGLSLHDRNTHGFAPGIQDVEQSALVNANDVLARYFDDVEGWYQYSLATIEFDLFIEIEILRRQKLENPERALFYDQVIDIYRSLSSHAQSQSRAPLSDHPDDFDQGALSRQNAILSQFCLLYTSPSPRDS